MLSEWMVESLLVGGIAGAGLVLTTLTLAVTKSDELLSERAKRLKRTKIELQSKSRKPEDQTQKIVMSANKISALKSLPDYLSELVLLSFLCFSGSSLLALLWFAGLQADEPVLEIGFALGVLSFLGMGWGMIADLESVLKQRYEKLKEEDKAESQ